MSRVGPLLETLRELWRYSRESRRIAFFLLAALLLLLGALIVLTEKSVLMPFIYTLF